MSPITLSELLEQLESFDTKNGCNVVFDFCDTTPTSFHSWRGDYAEIQLGFEGGQYMGRKEVLLEDFKKMVKDCIGKSFEGWKGGSFIMSKSTPVWVGDYGTCNGTGIMKATYNDTQNTVVLITDYYDIWS